MPETLDGVADAMIKTGVGFDHRVGHLWPLRRTLKLAKRLAWGTKALWPRTEAAGVVDTMIEAVLGEPPRLAS